MQRIFRKIELSDNEDKKIMQRINYLLSSFKTNKDLENKTLNNLEKYLTKDNFLYKLNGLFERSKTFKLIENFQCGKMFIKMIDIKLEKKELKFQEITSFINDLKNIFNEETIKNINEGKFIKFLNLFPTEDLFLEEIKELKYIVKLKKNK